MFVKMNCVGKTLTHFLLYVIISMLIYGALAQLGERYTGSVEVSGSIPLCSIKNPRSCKRGFFGYLINQQQQLSLSLLSQRNQITIIAIIITQRLLPPNQLLFEQQQQLLLQGLQQSPIVLTTFL